VHQVSHLVVVNDGSTDDTRRLIDMREEPNLSVIHLPKNGGAASAINAGVEYIRKHFEPQWLTWVSSDNIHHQNYAQRLLAVARSLPYIGAVYSGFACIEFPQKKKKPWRSFAHYDPARLHADEACYMGPSFVIREDVWQSHRGKNAHDYDNWVRVEEACWAAGLKIISIDEDLVTYRDHVERTGVRNRAGYDANVWFREMRDRRAKAGIVPPGS
jgi:glycosyltransferase involved in cell wall biosynthesis